MMVVVVAAMVPREGAPRAAGTYVHTYSADLT